jgi:starch synthase
VRLQVYFMDHENYFGEERLAADGGDVDAFEDVCRRALFFNRAALETIRKLRWGPSVIHSFGWMSGFVPFLLASEYGNDERLNGAKSVFTPDDQDPGAQISTDLAGTLGLSLDGQVGSTISETGLHYADASIHPPGAPTEDASQFEDDTGLHGQQLSDLYDQMIDEVPA